jgi:hypothetical protein
LAVDEEVCDALASIRDRVAVDIGRAGREFARVAHAVVVAVCLRWVRDSGAVVSRVSDAVPVGVDSWPRYCGIVGFTRGDSHARAEISRSVALTKPVASPASHDAVASDCDRMLDPRVGRGTSSKISRNDALAIAVVSPGADAAIESDC